MGMPAGLSTPANSSNGRASPAGRALWAAWIDMASVGATVR